MYAIWTQLMRKVKKAWHLILEFRGDLSLNWNRLLKMSVEFPFISLLIKLQLERSFSNLVHL